MDNLLEETKDSLAKDNKTLDDIEYILCDDGFYSVKDFIDIANFGHDSEFANLEIRQDLKLVGKDFWYEITEYDGGDWWVHKALPLKDGIKEISPTITIRR